MTTVVVVAALLLLQTLYTSAKFAPACVRQAQKKGCGAQNCGSLIPSAYMNGFSKRIGQNGTHMQKTTHKRKSFARQMWWIVMCIFLRSVVYTLFGVITVEPRFCWNF